MAIGAIGSGGAGPLPVGQAEGGGQGFASALTRMLDDANRDQVAAAGEAQRLVEGQGSIHEAMIAMSKAEGSFALMMEMRNRLIAAVNQLLQTQV
jgi:flagellar hook-basal body complex protein FliE